MTKKVMIIKSQEITYVKVLMHGNNNCEEVNSYKYLNIDLHHKLKQNYSNKKRINGGSKYYYGLENNCKSTYL